MSERKTVLDNFTACCFEGLLSAPHHFYTSITILQNFYVAFLRRQVLFFTGMKSRQEGQIMEEWRNGYGRDDRYSSRPGMYNYRKARAGRFFTYHSDLPFI
jgi:hypothetical protein